MKGNYSIKCLMLLGLLGLGGSIFATNKHSMNDPVIDPIVPALSGVSLQPAIHTYAHAAGDANWSNDLSNTTFVEFDSIQYKLSGPLASTQTLTLNDINAKQAPNGFDCAELFYHDKQAYVPLNTALTLAELAKQGIDLTGLPTSTSPVHLTAIPYKNTSGTTCSAPSSLSASQATAIWISNSSELLPAPANAIACDIPQGIHTEDRLPLTITDYTKDGCFVRPQWRVVKEADGKWYLHYTGTMYWLAQQNKPIAITLDPNADVQFPMTTEYVSYPTTLTDATEGACATALLSSSDPDNLTGYNTLDKYDLNNSAKFPFATCGLSSYKPDMSTEDFQRSYTYSEPVTQPIYVEGYGRIDGTTVISHYPQSSDKKIDAQRPCINALNLGSIYSCNQPDAINPGGIQPGKLAHVADKGLEFVRYAQWRIDTSLLGLSSSYKPSDMSTGIIKGEPGYRGKDPAIYVGGMTVSNAPIRNRSVVQLNVAQFGPKYAVNQVSPRELDNQPVVMNDVKQVGTWIGASDGADIGSDYSNMQNMYFNINDDSVKIEAQNQYYHNTTLLQGGIGGVMLGMYGVTRDGVDGSLVDGVYVPRINEIPSDPTVWNAYAATHGLVSTRTCPRYFQNGSTDMPSLGNVTVQNLRVFALADHSDPSAEPNSINALASVGVAAGSPYCSTDFDTKSLAPSFTFGPINLYKMQSDIAPISSSTFKTPMAPFVYYNQPIDADHKSTQVTWKGVNLSNDPTLSDVVYESGDSSSLLQYLFPCALDADSSDNVRCAVMQQSPAMQATYSSVKNNKKNILLLPIGTTEIPALKQSNYPTVESIVWPDSANAIVAPNGVSSDNAIHGATLDASATLTNPQPGDVLTYACSIHTPAPAHAAVANTTCTIPSTGAVRPITISGTGLNPANGYAIYVSATVTRNGVTVPDAQVHWIRLYKEIPAATASESINWPTADADISVPSTYSGTSLTGSLTANAILLKPQDGDQLVYSCGVYDGSMKPVIGATCKVAASNSTQHEVDVNQIPSTATDLTIHFSATVSRDGKTVPSATIPWVKVDKSTQRSS